MSAYEMKGRFKRKPRKVNDQDDTGNKTFLMINDPLAMDAEEREIIKMPIVDGRRKGTFKLIIEPWSDPLLVNTASKVSEG